MADTKRKSVRAAAARIAPNLDSADGTATRVLETIHDAARQAMELIVFPRGLRPLLPLFLLGVAACAAGPGAPVADGVRPQGSRLQA